MGVCSRRERSTLTTPTPRSCSATSLWEAEKQDVLGSFWLWHSNTACANGGGSFGPKRRGYSTRLSGSFGPTLTQILGFGAIFMQDNAPIHNAHIIRGWFRERGIEVMNWPPYSPDLNPIENLWALLKEKMYILHPELVGAPNNAETLDLLIRCAIDTWERLGEQLLNRLIDTMEHRVKAVLDAEGWYTKY